MKKTYSKLLAKQTLMASALFLMGGVIARLLHLFLHNETAAFLGIVLLAFSGSFLWKSDIDLVLRTAYFSCLISGSSLCLFQISIPVILFFFAFSDFAFHMAFFIRQKEEHKEIQIFGYSEE